MESPVPKKRWDGFTSWSFLEAGVDFEEFDLAPQLGRVAPSIYPLAARDEERANQLLDQTVCVSLHEHAGILPTDLAANEAYIRQGREWYGYEGLAASGLDAVFENFLDGYATNRLDVLYGLGVRMIGITYSESNALGSGMRDPGDGGLTAFGRRAVRRLNRLGMAIDVSHTGDATTLDTCRESDRPVFLSHAGARALSPMPKMREDGILQAVADTGGVIGIEASPHTTLTERHPRHSIESVMEHVEYCVDLVGIDHVALGPDTLFGDHVGLHTSAAAALDAGEQPDHEHVDYVEGFENPSEFPNAIRWLVAHGYDDEKISMIAGGSVLRALRDVWI